MKKGEFFSASWEGLIGIAITAILAVGLVFAGYTLVKTWFGEEENMLFEDIVAYIPTLDVKESVEIVGRVRYDMAIVGFSKNQEFIENDKRCGVDYESEYKVEKPCSKDKGCICLCEEGETMTSPSWELCKKVVKCEEFNLDFNGGEFCKHPYISGDVIQSKYWVPAEGKRGNYLLRVTMEKEGVISIEPARKEGRN